MSEETSGIQVGQQGDLVQVRVEGRGTQLNSHLLKQYLSQCLEQPKSCFEIDLAHCNYMDSTFLGMLAGIGLKVKTSGRPLIKLLNPTDRVRNMIESLGIDFLFEITTAHVDADSLNHLPGDESAKDLRTLEMLDAHENLVKIHPANETRFRDVLDLLNKKVGKINPP